jgi:hypothetical protein
MCDFCKHVDSGSAQVAALRPISLMLDPFGGRSSAVVLLPLVTESTKGWLFRRHR